MNTIQRNGNYFQNFDEAVMRFLAIPEWKFLKQTNEIDSFFKYILLENKAIIQRICEKYGLNESLFTYERFLTICTAENIRVSREEMPKLRKSIQGFYGYDAQGKFIWLKPSLKGIKLLLVAAHELGHNFFHTEKMRSGLLRKPMAFQRNGDATIEILMAEAEADFFACLLLVQTEVQ
jgi:Zn-dependent peptidase ImmA (M78 family)